MRALFLITLLSSAALPAMAQEPAPQNEARLRPPFEARQVEEVVFEECIRRRGVLTLAVLDYCNTGRTLVTMNGERLKGEPREDIISKGRIDRQPDVESVPEPKP